MPPNKRNFYPSRSNNDHHQQTTHQSSLLPSSSSPISIRATPLLELIASKCDPSHQSPDFINKPFFGTVLRSSVDRNIHKMVQLTNENPADVSYNLVTDAVNAGWCALGGSASHPNVRLTASGVKQLTASTSRYDLISFAAQFIAKQQQQEQQQQEHETPKQSRNDNAMMMMLLPKPKSKNEHNKIQQQQQQQQNMNNDDDDDDDIVLGYDPNGIIDDNDDDAVAVPSKSSTSANNSILSLPNPKSSLIRTKNEPNKIINAREKEERIRRDREQQMQAQKEQKQQAEMKRLQLQKQKQQEQEEQKRNRLLEVEQERAAEEQKKQAEMLLAQQKKAQEEQAVARKKAAEAAKRSKELKKLAQQKVLEEQEQFFQEQQREAEQRLLAAKKRAEEEEKVAIKRKRAEEEMDLKKRAAEEQRLKQEEKDLEEKKKQAVEQKRASEKKRQEEQEADKKRAAEELVLAEKQRVEEERAAAIEKQRRDEQQKQQQQITLRKNKNKLEKKLQGAIKAANYNSAIECCTQLLNLENADDDDNNNNKLSLSSISQLRKLADSLSASSQSSPDDIAKAAAYYSLAMKIVTNENNNDVSASLLCSRSRCHFDLGNIALSRADADSCCEKFPNFAEGYLRLGLATTEHDLISSFNSLKKSLELTKKNTTTADIDSKFVEEKLTEVRKWLDVKRDELFLAGKSRIQKQQNYKSAITLFNQARELDVTGDNADLFAYRSFCFLNTGNFDEALEEAEFAIAKQPSNVFAYLCAAEACEKIDGKFDQCQQFLKKAIELDDRKDETKTKSLNDLKKRVDLVLLKKELLDRAESLVAENEHNDALHFYTLTIDSIKSSATTGTTFRALFGRSKCYYDLCRYDESLADIARCSVVVGFIDTKDIVVQEARCADALKDWARALKCYNEYLQLDPSDALNLRIRRDVAEQNCRREEAAGNDDDNGEAEGDDEEWSDTDEEEEEVADLASAFIADQPDKVRALLAVGAKFPMQRVSDWVIEMYPEEETASSLVPSRYFYSHLKLVLNRLGRKPTVSEETIRLLFDTMKSRHLSLLFDNSTQNADNCYSTPLRYAIAKRFSIRFVRLLAKVCPKMLNTMTPALVAGEDGEDDSLFLDHPIQQSITLILRKGSSVRLSYLDQVAQLFFENRNVKFRETIVKVAKYDKFHTVKATLGNEFDNVKRYMPNKHDKPLLAKFRSICLEHDKKNMSSCASQNDDEDEEDEYYADREEDDEEWSDIDEEEEEEEEEEEQEQEDEEEETNRIKESAGYQFFETMQRTLEKVHPYHSMHYTNESERNKNKRFAEEELRRRNLKNKRGGSFEEELDRIWLERMSKTGSVHERAPGED